MRTQYELPCSCGTVAVVDPGQAGQAIVCAKCRGEITVPTLLEMRRLKRVEVYDAATAPTDWSLLQSLLFGFGCILVAGAIATAVLYGWRWSQVNDTEQPGTDRIVWRQDFDKMKPTESLDVWRAFEIDLPYVGKPYWLQQREWADHYRLITLSAGGVALLGALLAVASYFMPASKPVA